VSRILYTIGALLLCHSPSHSLCLAQDITVHVVESGTLKPIPGIDLNLRIDCMNPKRPKAFQQRTDPAGVAVFRAVSLKTDPICIDLFSIAYRSLDLDAVFASPYDAERLKSADKMKNPIITSLPAEVTFHVRKRTLSEQLHFMFRGD
jgi:hypothetical protein